MTGQTGRRGATPVRHRPWSRCGSSAVAGPASLLAAHHSIADTHRNRGRGNAVTRLSLLAFSGTYGRLPPACRRPVTTELADVTTVNDTIRKFGYPATTVAEYDRWVVLLR